MAMIEQVTAWLWGGREPLPATRAATAPDIPAAAGGHGGVLGPAIGGHGGRLWPPAAGQGLTSGGRVRPRPAPVADHVAALVAALERGRPGDECRAYRERGVCARWRVLETYAAVAEQLQLVCLHDIELLEALGQHCRRARLMALPATSLRPARQTCYVLGEPVASGKPKGKKAKAKKKAGAPARGRIGPMYRRPANFEEEHVRSV